MSVDPRQFEAYVKSLGWGYFDGIDAICIVIAKCVADEREACAKIVDEEADSYDGDAAAIAAERIRGRT